MTAISMTGHQLPIIGEVKATINVGNHYLYGTIVVAEKAPYDLIIGTDLMKDMGNVQFDFEKRIIFGWERTTRDESGQMSCCSLLMPADTSTGQN